jgi:hypothetical protein
LAAPQGGVRVGDKKEKGLRFLKVLSILKENVILVKSFKYT